MTTSSPDTAFVHIWLPDQPDPVVAGRLDVVGDLVTFTYGRSYLDRPDRIALWKDLPLQRGAHFPAGGPIAGCIADAAPDAWGRRVILNRQVGGEALDTDQLPLMTYLLSSGSNRIGALDFQESTTYRARVAEDATLDELARSAAKVDEGLPLSPGLDQALLHGSSVGGARPKTLLTDGNRQLIAKFSSSTDEYSIVKGEFVAMRLARRAGIDVAEVELTSALGKDVLLVERFDRKPDGSRRALVSALTVLELQEDIARYGTYFDFADRLRAEADEPKATLRELFSRITFNILTGNTDDHPRNHAVIWNGERAQLSPAYDICPQPRSGGEAAQIMAIGRDGWRMSQVAGCLEHAGTYLLSEREARAIIDEQIQTIRAGWDDVCEEARLSAAERSYFWERQFLNPYALHGWESAAA